LSGEGKKARENQSQRAENSHVPRKGGPRMAPETSLFGRNIVLLRAAVVAVTATLYLVGCCLPATTIRSFDGNTFNLTIGWEHLAWAWLDFPRSFPAWSANFVLGAGIIVLLRGLSGRAAALGCLAMVLGLTTLISYEWDGRYIGFYFWQGSLVT